MFLPYEAQKEVYDFFEDIKNYNRCSAFPELEYSRGKRNYERILRRLETVALPNPALLKFKSLTTRELKDYLVEIMCKIFGPSYKNQIEKYNRLVRLEQIDNPFEATIETDLVGDMQVPKNIFISSRCASIQVVSTGHEYTHCFVSKYDTHLFNNVMSNVHYKELLPIIVEYIICYELSQLLKEENIENKHQLIRIDHDKNQASERKAASFLKAKLRKVQGDEAEWIKKYIEYQEHNSFGYILSDMYAIHLLDVYKNSSENLITLIKEIFAGEKSINDLISYFNLSLTNTDVIDKYNKAIDAVALTKRK